MIMIQIQIPIFHPQLDTIVERSRGVGSWAFTSTCFLWRGGDHHHLQCHNHHHHLHWYDADDQEAFISWSSSDSLYGSRHLAATWANTPFTVRSPSSASASSSSSSSPSSPTNMNEVQCSECSACNHCTSFFQFMQFSPMPFLNCIWHVHIFVKDLCCVQLWY